MSASDYYEKVSSVRNRLDTFIKAFTEAQKIISPSSKDRDTFPGLIDSTPKHKQRELLNNAWIVLKGIDERCELGSDIDELFLLLEDVDNSPVEPEPEFQGHELGQ